MPNQKPLCFYYPTTTLVVDDNQDFLDHLADAIDPSTPYLAFNSPKKALSEITKFQALNAEDFLGFSGETLFNEPLHVNIPKILSLAKSNSRSKTPAVVVVDHDMPEMSGIEFCEKLSSHPIKKIMLTAAADHQLAVKAFNAGVIDQFISKDDPNVVERLNDAIQEMQKKYFETLSAPLLKNLTATSSSLLENKAFQKFLGEFIQKNEVTEFYLADPTGSFLMFSSGGKKLQLVVQTEAHIKKLIALAKDYEAPKEIIHALETQKALLCFLDEADLKAPVSTWKSYLHPARALEGTSGAYCCVS